MQFFVSFRSVSLKIYAILVTSVAAAVVVVVVVRIVAPPPPLVEALGLG